MIKKVCILFFLIFISLTFFNITVNGETFIELPKEYIQIGIGYDDLINEDNLTVKSGYVNWELEGTYTVIYNDRLNNNYKKKFVIIDCQENQYFLDESNEYNIPFSKVNEIVDVFYISDSSYYVVSNYQIPDPTFYDQEKICITFYENNQYKWEYRYYKYSRYNNAILYENNLIVSGLVYNQENNINTTVLFEITKDRQIIKSREIKANQSVYSYGIHLFENNLFLITSTSGNDYDYKNIKDDYLHRLVILKLNYENFQIIQGKMETKLQNFSVIDCSFFDTRIAINVLTKENTIINSFPMTNCIYEYNDNLELKNQYYFNTQYREYYGHQITQSDICYFYIDNFNNIDCIKIEYLNKGVIKKNLILDLQNQSCINNLQVLNVNGNDIYICLKNGINENGKFLGYAKINSELGIQYFSKTKEDIDVLSSKINNGYIINTYKKDNNIYYKSYNLLEINTNGNETEQTNENKKKIIVNTQNIQTVKYINIVNKNIYGNYKNLKFMIDHFNNEYVFCDDIEVLLDVNVESGAVYQKGLNLKFNGIGYLNGEMIEKNFIINDIGKYHLEIEGENIENTQISFEVAELTVTHKEKEHNDFSFDPISTSITSVLDESYVNTTCNFNVNKNYNNLIPLVISIISFGVLSIILMRKKI